MEKNQIEQLRLSLKKTIIFRFLTDNELELILKEAKILSFKKDDNIIAKDEISSNLFIVLKGTVSVMVDEENKKPVYICSIGEGEVFGEAGIFMNVKRTANVISQDISSILVIERKDFISFIKAYPNAGIKILMLVIFSLLRKLKEANQEIAFERKYDISQDDIDLMVDEVMKE